MRSLRHECSHCGAGVISAEYLHEGVCIDCQKMFESMIETAKAKDAKEKREGRTVDDYLAEVNRRKAWSNKKR